MENTGLVNKYISASLTSWAAIALLERSPQQQTVTSSQAHTLRTLKEVSTSSLDIILQVELHALKLELEHHGNSVEERNSLLTALQQGTEGLDSYNFLVNDSTAYKAGLASYSSKRKEAGLPIDAFREFIKSHSTRLTNRLASPLSVAEKNILRQRKENLKISKELYIEMQREVLGQGKSNEKGLER